MFNEQENPSLRKAIANLLKANPDPTFDQVMEVVRTYSEPPSYEESCNRCVSSAIDHHRNYLLNWRYDFDPGYLANFKYWNPTESELHAAIELIEERNADILESYNERLQLLQEITGETDYEQRKKLIQRYALHDFISDVAHDINETDCPFNKLVAECLGIAKEKKEV